MAGSKIGLKIGSKYARNRIDRTGLIGMLRVVCEFKVLDCKLTLY